MKILTAIFALLLLAAIPMQAQVENSRGENPFYAPPPFFFDLIFFAEKDTPDTRMDVFVQVPFASIQFVKNSEAFIGEYTLTVSVYDESKKKLLTERSWNEKITVREFPATKSVSSFNLSMKSFLLKTGTYHVKLTLEDRDSRAQFTRTSDFAVRGFKKPFDVSDIMLIAETSHTDKKRIIPNVSKNVADQKNGIPIFFEVYADSAATVSLEYRVVDFKNNEVFKSVETRDLKDQKTAVVFTIQGLNLNLGDYTVIVTLTDPKTGLKYSVGKSFFSRWIGIPSTLEDLEKAIDQMTYIANSSELDYIREGAEYYGKLERFVEYWKKKDPSPTTKENEMFIEYFRRIAYANKHFSKMLEGWRSDMGMVYIILGPPSNVERHPFEYDSKPYEVWEYYEINRSFIFVDTTGFGDYRLISPFFGEYYYRP